MNRLYVVSDNSLDPIYASVQSGHAVAQWLLEHPDQTWNNEYLIYVKANNEIIRLLEDRFDSTVFHEPDLDNKITAVALVLTSKNKSILHKLKLLS